MRPVLRVTLLAAVTACATHPGATDSADSCHDVTPEGAEEAYRVAACEYNARCSEGGSSADSCIESWESDATPKLPKTCIYEDFDPCAAEKCILFLTAPRRSCEQGFPGINDCFGMFTNYGCGDV